MPGAPHKMARDLKPDDQVMANASKHLPVRGVVLAVLPIVKTMKRRLIMVTIRTQDGEEIHRHYGEHASIPMAEGES